MKNIFEQPVVEELIGRINNLHADARPKWGKMSAPAMIAHCNVTYEMVYNEGMHPRPNFLVRFILKKFIKDVVVSEKPFKKNSGTAPQFLIKTERDFEKEKTRLIAHLRQTAELGMGHFDNKESHSFGKLTAVEWNNMFYKHLDHHLTQFGV